MIGGRYRNLLLAVGLFAATVVSCEPSQAQFTLPARRTISATAIDSKTIKVSWNDVDNLETGYVLEKSFENDFTEAEQIKLSADSTSYVDSNAGFYTTTYYRLIAENSMGSIGPGEAIAASTKSLRPKFTLPPPMGDLKPPIDSTVSDLAPLAALQNAMGLRLLVGKALQPAHF